MGRTNIDQGCEALARRLSVETLVLILQLTLASWSGHVLPRRMANEWKPKKSQEKSLHFLYSSPNHIYCSPRQIIPKIAFVCCYLAIQVGSTSCINLPLLYYCSWIVAILPPWVFYRSIFQSYGSCKPLLCEFRQAKKN